MRVQKLGTERYMIEDAVIISDINYSEDGISYMIDYDEKIITSNEAEKLCNYFFEETLYNGIHTPT